MTMLGHYSILRWRADATRDEARNVAIILVDEGGRFGGVRAAPISAISPRLREQGILDSALAGLQRRFESDDPPTLKTLNDMRVSFDRSLYLTEPTPVVVPDVDAILDALYRAYAAPRGGGGHGITKGFLLDRVVGTLRRTGLSVRRGGYVSDFLIDVVVDTPTAVLPPFIEVLSFAALKLDWTDTEYDAGHFLFALERLERPGMAVIQPPTVQSQPSAFKSHERVLRWCEQAKVPTRDPEALAGLVAQSNRGQTKLPI